MFNTPTNWHVITGGPSAGKTKTLEHLLFRGHKIIPEAARILIDDEMSKGRTLAEIRHDEHEFQKKVLQMKLDAENRLNTQECLFFDRGIADSIAYYRFVGADSQPAIEVAQHKRYKTIFLLDQLPFQVDGVRIENESSARRINDLLFEAYSQLDYKVIRVPVMPISERVDFILAEANIA